MYRVPMLMIIALTGVVFCLYYLFDANNWLEKKPIDVTDRNLRRITLVEETCAGNYGYQIIKVDGVEYICHYSGGICALNKNVTTVIHDTIIKTDTVFKVKNVYITKEPFKSDIPSTILFKKE